MSGPVSLARPDLKAFVPYESAVPRADMIRLHANESPWRHDFDDTERGLNRYPDPRNDAVAGRLAGLYGVPKGEVLLTRGSDDAIDVLVRAFCEAGRDRVVKRRRASSRRVTAETPPQGGNLLSANEDRNAPSIDRIRPW